MTELQNDRNTEWQTGKNNMPPDLRSRGHKNLQKKLSSYISLNIQHRFPWRPCCTQTWWGFFWLILCFSTLYLNLIWYRSAVNTGIFLHQTEEYELFCHLAILLCFDKCSSPNMTLLILKPTLIAVVLNMCWLRVFHNKRISLQNKNTCSVVSLSFLQNAQQSSALMFFFQIMTNW